MKGFSKFAILLIFILLLSACTTAIKRENLQNVKTVGVINRFPTYPCYILVGVAYFNDNNSEIADRRFKENITYAILDNLKLKGYSAETTDKADLESYDMVIELMPPKLPDELASKGYGVYQKFMLGTPMPGYVFVAINMKAYLHGLSSGNNYYLYNTKTVQTGALPSTWGELSLPEKVRITEKLNENIRETVNQLLMKVGF